MHNGCMTTPTPATAVDRTVSVITATTLWQQELATADPEATIDRIAELVEFYSELHQSHPTVPALTAAEVRQVTDILVSRQEGGDDLLAYLADIEENLR